jgi:hypothetical protein
MLYASAVHGAIPPKPVPPPSSAELVSFTGNSTFQQLIDHENPHLGTFSQRYWWNSEWWSGEGSPVVQAFTFSFLVRQSTDMKRYRLCFLLPERVQLMVMVAT